MRRVSDKFRVIENPDPCVWDDFVRARGGHLLQSAAWGELKERFGWNALRLALERDGALVAGAQMLFRCLPLGLRLAYVPRGPVADPLDRATLAALFDVLRAAARSTFALKVEPDWVDHAPLAAWLAARGFLPSASVQPRTTIHVDLTRELGAILAQMKPKWRYNIRLAERKGVTVREGSADDMAMFYQLLRVTSARDAFAVHSMDYYRAAFDLFTARDCARLFVAEYQREPLAAIFVTAFGGEAIYLYGASSNAHRERMPNHALHWAAIQWAKARGCARYDLWGIAATAEADVESGLLHGLYQFKQGFGGRVVRYIGGYDAVFSRVRYALYTRAVAWRRGELG
jgi:lipid II:glycine glycyltransferase (peptidoglycan interpeptide bridge formation enzyme)